METNNLACWDCAKTVRSASSKSYQKEGSYKRYGIIVDSFLKKLNKKASQEDPDPLNPIRFTGYNAYKDKLSQAGRKVVTAGFR